MKNYYKLLGVTENASHSEIQLAYTNMYHKCLLDKDSGNNVDEKLIDILVAYNALTNNKIKKEYDKVLNSDRPEEILEPLQKNTPRPWFKSQPLSVISITTLIGIFTYTLIILFGYAQTKNSNTTTASTTKPHKVNNIPKIEVFNQNTAKRGTTLPRDDGHTPGSPLKKNQPILAIATKNKKTPLQEPSKQSPIYAKNEQPDFNTELKGVKQGSVKGEVLKMRGTPNAIVRFDNQNEIWCYSNEKISFTNGIATSIQPTN